MNEALTRSQLFWEEERQCPGTASLALGFLVYAG